MMTWAAPLWALSAARSNPILVPSWLWKRCACGGWSQRAFVQSRGRQLARAAWPHPRPSCFYLSRRACTRPPPCPCGSPCLTSSRCSVRCCASTQESWCDICLLSRRAAVGGPRAREEGLRSVLGPLHQRRQQHWPAPFHWFLHHRHRGPGRYVYWGALWPRNSRGLLSFACSCARIECGTARVTWSAAGSVGVFVTHVEMTIAVAMSLLCCSLL